MIWMCGGLSRSGSLVSPLVVALLVAGCGASSGSGGAGVFPTPGILFEKHRDAGGAISTVLDESGSGFDADEVDSPAVIVDSGRTAGDKFVMYYEADSGGTSVIGVVTSDEDDFATLTVGRTQAVGLGGAGSGYDGAATDPSVLVDKSVPFGTSGRYQMWFEGRSGVGNADSTIVHCLSSDGVAWTDFTECTGLSASFGTVRIADPCVIEDGGKYRMWFEAIGSTRPGGGDGFAVVGYADSPDGVAWTVRDADGNTGATAGAVFVPGPVGAFDGYGVGSPAVFEDATVLSGDPRTYVMLYEAADDSEDTVSTIGLAWSADGLDWFGTPSPVLDPSSDSLVPLPFDSGDVEHPSLWIDTDVAPTEPGRYLLWYTGDGEGNASPNRIGLARGSDR